MPATLPQLLFAAAEANPDAPAFKVERPCPELRDGTVPPALPEEEWTTWTYQEYLNDARKAARAFVSLGFEQFDSVSVWGFNSPEWVLSAVAATIAGGKVAGLYPTDTPETVAYKVVQSGASIVVIEDKGKLTKLLTGLAVRKDCRRLKAIVAYGFVPAAGETADVAGIGKVPLLSFTALLEKGQPEVGGPAQEQKMFDAAQTVDQRISATDPGHCAAIIYTSGTTGEPKAVMISHDNITYESTTVVNMLRSSCGFAAQAEQERLLSYLPLSHVAGVMVDVCCPLVTSAGPAWVTTYFARNYDLKAGSIKDRLCLSRPTIFLGVPLVWEKIADKIRAIGASTTGVKKMLADWAKGLALEYSQSHQIGGKATVPMGHSLAEKLVLSKIKQNLGLQCCKFGFAGAAPIRVDTLQYFGSLGIGIREVYGMSECTGACSWSSAQAYQWGSCGWELPGCEVKAFRVDEADFCKKTECMRAPSLDTTDEQYQGELCFRGRNIMMGYMANPDLGQAHVKEMEKKTAETIDAEGWLHSGDKGMITADGMVKITGRYKELIIGDGGENIAPVPIEDHVKKTCDGLAEVMMIGDKRKYNVALVTLKAAGANGESPGTDALDAGAKRVSPAVTKISEAMDDPTWIKAVTEAIQSANKNTKVCINNSFTIQKFTILPENFSEQNNELTPTKKLKRKAVETRYAAMIERMYATEGTYIRFSEK